MILLNPLPSVEGVMLRHLAPSVFVEKCVTRRSLSQIDGRERTEQSVQRRLFLPSLSAALASLQEPHSGTDPQEIISCKYSTCPVKQGLKQLSFAQLSFVLLNYSLSKISRAYDTESQKPVMKIDFFCCKMGKVKEFVKMWITRSKVGLYT